MINRFNYTGRHRIPHRLIRLVVHDRKPWTFDADWDSLGEPLDARGKIYVEATSSGSPTVRRFDCGTVAEPVRPRGVPLGDLGGESPVFAFKVVDESDEVGLILAWAENLHPERPDLGDDDARAPLLPVNFVDLGEVPWRLSFDNAGDQPYLLVSRHLPHGREFVRGKTFGPLVFPHVVEQVLRRVVEFAHTDVTNDDADWRDLWLRLALARNGGELPPSAESAADPTDEERRAQHEWVLRAVDRFADKQGWRNALVEAMEEDDA